MHYSANLIFVNPKTRETKKGKVATKENKTKRKILLRQTQSHS